MKKYLLSIIGGLFLSILTYAQSGLNMGFSIGFPYENYEGYEYSFAFNGDINYLFEVSSAFDLGLASGYGHAIGSSTNYFYPNLGISRRLEIPDYQYVPVALAGRIHANSRLTLGGDIGYAISVSSAKDVYFGDYYTGGFYWRPMVGFNLNNRIQLNANYIGISDDYFYYSAFNLGFMINLN